VVEVADVGQVVAPFEGDQPGVGQAFGQLQPAAVGYYAVTSVVQHERGCAHRRQEGFDVGGVDGREISGGNVAVGRVSQHRDHVVGRLVGQIGPVEAGEQLGAEPPVTAHQRDEGGVEVWAYEYFGGAGIGPEEHQSPNQIRSRRGERDGNRPGLGHGEQIDRRTGVGRDGGQLGHARVQLEVVHRTGGASGPVAVVHDQCAGSD